MLDPTIKEAFDVAYSNICAFHAAQKSPEKSVENMKGMRIVHTPDEFVESFLAAQSEAAASFGVNTILLENYITRPRHIEVQIFGNKHGNVLHLYERDCSVQRRQQKIIEEAPSPNVSTNFRAHLGQVTASAAKSWTYFGPPKTIIQRMLLQELHKLNYNASFFSMNKEKVKTSMLEESAPHQTGAHPL